MLPPREIVYRGVQLAEMDLPAILARRPEVVLVDELAHTNVPGGSPSEALPGRAGDPRRRHRAAGRLAVARQTLCYPENAVRTTRRPFSRSFLAWLLAALALSTALELHPAGEAIEGGAGGETLAVPATAHAVTSTHVEAAFEREVPPCPACLLRTQTRGLRLVVAARLAAPLPAERVEAESSYSPARRASRPRAARAPPLA